MPNIGMNLWVTAASDQGGRKYMEDVIDVKFDRKSEDDDPRFAYFAVFDGHGGPEAAEFAKKHLLKEIMKIEGFWCEDDDEKVLNAISEGFKATHKLMWNVVGSWPLTSSGFPSTSGCTASVVFIRHSKMYVGHVGDSAIVMGVQEQGSNENTAFCVTEDHKPEKKEEKSRIEGCGGKVLIKSGVHRVVWDRPRRPFKGPIRRSTPIDHIPFLAVSRALGDLWSYNADNDMFVVSPEPDVCCYKLDPNKHKCLVLASDGLWNVVNSQKAVDLVMDLQEKHKLSDNENTEDDQSIARHVMDYALQAWRKRTWRADNISVIVIEIDPPGLKETETAKPSPSRASSVSTVLLSGGEEDMDTSDDDNTNTVTPCREWDHDDLPRSTSNTPISSHIVPFTPLNQCQPKNQCLPKNQSLPKNQCLPKNQPINLFKLATAPKTLPSNVKAKPLSKFPSFEGDDQDSRDTGFFTWGNTDVAEPALHPWLEESEAASICPLQKSKLLTAPITSNSKCKGSNIHNGKHPQPNQHEDKPTSHADNVNNSCKHSSDCSTHEASCSSEHTGESKKPNNSKIEIKHDACNCKVVCKAPRSPRQVGLNLTNNSGSSTVRRPLETPAGWTSIKGVEQEQQVTACSAIGSELAAGIWPDSLHLGTDSISDPLPIDAMSCHGSCEYTAENAPCNKCNPSKGNIKRVLKRKASPPPVPLSKRFRRAGVHRTRATINNIRPFHCRSTRKSAST